MSTFLIGLVVVAATVLVIRVALSDPDQPATIRRPTGRDRPARRRRPPSPARPPSVKAAAPAEATAPVRPRTAVTSARRPRRQPARGWVRLRSGVALVVLVTFVGVLMAVTTGAGLALAARALRHAVG